MDTSRRQLLRPIAVGRTSLWPRPHRYLLLQRLERHHIIFQLLTGTGTSSGTSPNSTLPQAPTAGTGINEALEALAATTNAPAKCGVGIGCSASTVGLPLNLRRLRCNPRDFAILGDFIIEYRRGSGIGNRFPVSKQDGDFCCHPRVSSVRLTIAGITSE